jgi:hypothetical protein
MADRQKLEDVAAQFSPEMNVATGKWFGKPCLKVDGKVFAALWGGDMVFKLTGEAHAEALQIEGAHLFDPRGKGHPMRAWVQIPAAQSATWGRFARLACEYVAGAAQAKKEGIIADLVEARGKILDAASSLSPADQDRVFLGVWSVKDLLAHLVGWDFANLEAAQAILAGQLPGFYAHYDRDWRTYNARLVAEYKREDFADLRASVEDSHQKLIGFLETIPAEEFDRDRGVRFKGYKVTIARTLEAELEDEREHHRQIEELSCRVKLHSSREPAPA